MKARPLEQDCLPNDVLDKAHDAMLGRPKPADGPGDCKVKVLRLPSASDVLPSERKEERERYEGMRS